MVTVLVLASLVVVAAVLGVWRLIVAVSVPVQVPPPDPSNRLEFSTTDCEVETVKRLEGNRMKKSRALISLPAVPKALMAVVVQVMRVGSPNTPVPVMVPPLALTTSEGVTPTGSTAVSVLPARMFKLPTLGVGRKSRAR